MLLPYNEWRHVFKLDPAKDIEEDVLQAIATSGTDAIIVGGTDDITLDATLDLLMRLRRYPVAVALEVSELEAATMGFDTYLTPSVLNSGTLEHVIEKQVEALEEVGHMLAHADLVGEGYIVLNPDAKVAHVTQAKRLTDDTVIAYAQLADRVFRMPIIYLEYSGIYGDPKLVASVKKVLKQGRLFYGGGIDSGERAKEMSAYADTIIVGNIIYENLEAALATVAATR
ncbi:heptaprenylglyceryl phosphate synthase [Exiguobacterium antarcticum]|uniref:Heptaprenylglyceryl phosphate synthase n=1 Tax=Exiguobacterium antarcticum TaxID=132920 RepID=A0ABT6R2A0_9BACL|nr:heptaprenylglyceryl phosphate synthase [Exiguobacterium antarcticum]AFS69597.1 Heptaprenylglyceryl phosphate synthase [Exiguobacterium antarcticum B7]MDI3234933.1 heptaprenylglyceryl phosphate synthase [Exiguobacterium antarcticum]